MAVAGVDREDVVGAVGDVDRAFVLERLALGGELRRGGVLTDLGHPFAFEFFDVFGVDFAQRREAVVGRAAAVGDPVVAGVFEEFFGGECGAAAMPPSSVVSAVSASAGSVLPCAVELVVVVPPLPPQAASTSAAASASNSVGTQSRRWPFGLPKPLNIYFHPFPDIGGGNDASIQLIDTTSGCRTLSLPTARYQRNRSGGRGMSMAPQRREPPTLASGFPRARWGRIGRDRPPARGAARAPRPSGGGRARSRARATTRPIAATSSAGTPEQAEGDKSDQERHQNGGVEAVSAAPIVHVPATRNYSRPGAASCPGPRDARKLACRRAAALSGRSRS